MKAASFPFKYFLLILGLVVCLLLSLFWGNKFFFTLLSQIRQIVTDGERVRAAILSSGPLAPLFFIGLQVLQVLLAPIPGEATGIVGGYLFGAWPGFFYSTIGLTIGSWIAFLAGRLLGSSVLRWMKATKAYRKFNRVISKKDFIIPFLLFMVPGFPKDSLSYLLGFSRMQISVFLFLTTLGRIPGTLMLSLQGAEVYEENYQQFLVLLLVTAAIFLPCYFWRHKIFNWLEQRAKQAATNNGPASNPQPRRGNDITQQ